jgi:hypothetical protein
MPYQVPPRPAHGDTIDAVLLNKYSDSLNAIYSATPVTRLDFAVRKTMNADTYYGYVHNRRYLYYKGSGKLYSADLSQTTALSDGSNGGTNVYDLDSVAWLAYGAIYYATGVTAMIEYDV